MPAITPEAVSEAFRAAIDAGDVAAALELWAEDAAIVGLDGRAIAGREAIAAALHALVEHRIGLDISIARVITAGAVAVAVGTLTMRGMDAQGRRFEHCGDSTVVYLRQADGCWRLAIDAPWGLPTPRGTS